MSAISVASIFFRTSTHRSRSRRISLRREYNGIRLGIENAASAAEVRCRLLARACSCEVVRVLAAWVGLSYAPLYDSDIVGPPRTAGQRNKARHLEEYKKELDRRELEYARWLVAQADAEGGDARLTLGSAVGIMPLPRLLESRGAAHAPRGLGRRALDRVRAQRSARAADWLSPARQRHDLRVRTRDSAIVPVPTRWEHLSANKLETCCRAAIPLLV
jgi:hypothetical protein